MYERFTEPARYVVVRARDYARDLKHNYIGTEHILFGLFTDEGGIAAQALDELGITSEQVNEQVVQIVGCGEHVPQGMIPFTPRAKAICELALREAINLGHSYIGTEHILLGLVRENGGVAAQILIDFDTDAEQIRELVIRKMISGAGTKTLPSSFVVALRELQQQLKNQRTVIGEEDFRVLSGHLERFDKRARRTGLL